MHRATELFHKTEQEKDQDFGSGGVVCWIIVFEGFFRSLLYVLEMLLYRIELL